MAKRISTPLPETIEICSELEPGVLLVHKPIDISSFDVIRVLRRQLGERKIGHAGTLDPFATGLMIVGVGVGTKRLEHYIKRDKTYRATIHLGITTETGDATGATTSVVAVHAPYDTSLVLRSIQDLVGVHEYPVPVYSALKVSGVAQYARVRAGEEVIPIIRTMQVYSVSDISYNHPHITFTATVASGTYIRSLAVRVGEVLGCGATLCTLARVHIDTGDN